MTYTNNSDLLAVRLVSRARLPGDRRFAGDHRLLVRRDLEPRLVAAGPDRHGTRQSRRKLPGPGRHDRGHGRIDRQRPHATRRRRRHQPRIPAPRSAERLQDRAAARVPARQYDFRGGQGGRRCAPPGPTSIRPTSGPTVRAARAWTISTARRSIRSRSRCPFRRLLAGSVSRFDAGRWLDRRRLPTSSATTRCTCRQSSIRSTATRMTASQWSAFRHCSAPTSSRSASARSSRPIRSPVCRAATADVLGTPAPGLAGAARLRRPVARARSCRSSRSRASTTRR